MKIVIGTESPPKVAAIREAIEKCPYFHGKNPEIITKKVSSGISDMPTSMTENMLGAKNRAKNAKKSIPDADFYIGMEGGTDFIGEKSYLFGVVYILDRHENGHFGMSNMVEVPKIFHEKIYFEKKELGPILSEITGVADASKKNGAFGAWTDDVFTRKDQFIFAFLSAMAPFYNNIMSYSQISFFEEINFGSSERMHSEIIRWILSGNFPEINNTILSDFYKNFLKIENIPEVIFCGNEIENIDIFIETQNEIIIIENKFKSSEHSNQLEKYENILREKYPDKQHFCFLLTLINEKASSENWTNTSYKELLNALQKLPQKIQKHYIIENYILYLEKITKTLDSIIKNPQNYKSIFLNGNIKKVEKNENFLNTLPTEEEKFIAKNQLETIFQKAYLYSIISKIKEINKFHINETHGTAMLQIPIAEEIIYQNEKFNIFLEVQNQTIKYCFMHENYFHSNHKIIEKIPKIFEEIFKNSPFTKINSPRKYAFVSASRKLTKPYYEMEAEEFQGFMKKEIDIVKKLTEKFLQKI